MIRWPRRREAHRIANVELRRLRDLCAGRYTTAPVIHTAPLPSLVLVVDDDDDELHPDRITPPMPASWPAETSR